jgi:hypothetical protein
MRPCDRFATGVVFSLLPLTIATLHHQVTLDTTAEPIEFGSRRHPLADVCFGWIECMQPRVLRWAVDNFLVAGPSIIYDIGVAVLKVRVHLLASAFVCHQLVH